MPLFSLHHRIQCNPMVKGGQRASVRDCQRQQIQVGDLSMPEDSAPVHQPIGTQADVVGPELVVYIGAGQSHLCAHGFKACGAALAVAGQVQHAQHAVFYQRAGGNFKFGFLKEGECLCVVNMGIV